MKQTALITGVLRQDGAYLAEFLLKKNKVIIRVSKKFIRKKEYKLLIGNSSKAKKFLNWKSNFNLRNLVKDMIDEEIKYN